MAHNRKLVIGGVALVKARLKDTGPAMVSVCDDIERVLIESNFFANSPFKWISLIIRYGLEDKFEPAYRPINKTHGDLPVSIEVDTHPLLGADIETIKAVFRRATIEALLHVARKYNLPEEPLGDYRNGLDKENRLSDARNPICPGPIKDPQPSTLTSQPLSASYTYLANSPLVVKGSVLTIDNALPT